MVLKNVGKSGLYKIESNTLEVRFYVNQGYGNFFLKNNNEKSAKSVDGYRV